LHSRAEDWGAHPALAAELLASIMPMPGRRLPEEKVFSYKGKSGAPTKRSFVTACKNAGIQDITFHDLRHTAINNWRQQDHDYFRIMAASGHKTMEVFKRYNSVSKKELKKLVEGKVQPLDSNMDT
jgi:integrase